MKWLRLILHRPASAFLVILTVVIFGVFSITGMSLEYMPDMSMPMELVMISWPSADADSIERLVTEPVEEKCETLTGISSISSTTSDNYTMIQLSYSYSTDLDDAYMELKAAMDNLAATLPDGCGAPSIMELSMTSDTTLSISATSPSGTDIQSYMEDTVVPTLESLNGVAKVDISGASEEYMRIVLDEAAMQEYGLSISDIGSAISAADFDMPIGTVSIGTQDIAISATGDIRVDSPALLNVPIRTSGGPLIHLSDVISFANLYRADAESISRYNGQESILLEVTKQNSASTFSVCGSVEDTLERFTAEGDMSFRIIASDAENILDTLIEVVKTLAIGVLLTMTVLLIFFGNIRASLIVGCSMPLSILLALILLSQVGYGMDLMTGTALIIAIGMIVDNSIVVMESCMRARENGLDFREAAIQGTGEVLKSVFASTLTTVVVYVPLALAGGMAGQIAGPLSWTISLTMISSFLSAVTVVPLIFNLAKPVPKEKLPINRILSNMQNFYRRVMPSILRHPGRAILFSVAILAGAVLLAVQLEVVMFPNNYDGSIQVEAVFRSGTKLSVMDERIQELEAALLEDSEFGDVTLSLSGNKAVFTAYAGDRCKRSSEDAAEEYLLRFGSSPGMDVSVTPTGASNLGEGSAVEITLSADNMDCLQKGASMVAETMTAVPGVLQIDNPFAQSRLQGKLVLDAQKVMAAGLNPSTAALQTRYLLNGLTAASIAYDGKEYDVILEYPEGRYDDLTVLMNKSLTTPTGKQIALKDVASIEYSNALPSISRRNGSFTTTITASISEAAKADATRAIEAAVEALNFPEGVGQGTNSSDESMISEVMNLLKTLVVGIFLVFLVMALQFNSPRLSLMVMLCIPFSLAGSFGMLFLTGNPLSMMGIMGFLMLFGIVVNNGILLIDATNELRRTMPLDQAMIQAGVTRLRPILMTTLTTVLSMIPLVLTTNGGMSMMREMGFVIVGGLVASTILTLFLMHPFYLLIRRENLDGTKKRKLIN